MYKKIGAVCGYGEKIEYMIFFFVARRIYKLRLEKGRDKSCMHECFLLLNACVLLMILMVDTNESSLRVVIVIYLLNGW